VTELTSTRSPSGCAVVLGMHRSGTSLTAQLLSRLGWFLGSEEDLLGPRDDNQQGFFERADVQLLNDRMLRSLGSWWDAPPSEDAVLAAAADHAGEVQSLVSGLTASAGARPYAIKDPRISLLWPIWTAAFPADILPVLAVRHPLEVAFSLRHRDGIGVVDGLALWEAYTCAALGAADGRRVVVANYGSLTCGDPLPRARFLKALGVVAGSCWDTAIRPDLHHAKAPAAADNLLSSQQAAMWNWLSELPEDVELEVPVSLLNKSASTGELLSSRRVTRNSFASSETQGLERDDAISAQRLAEIQRERERELLELQRDHQLQAQVVEQQRAETRALEDQLAVERDGVRLLEVSLENVSQDMSAERARRNQAEDLALKLRELRLSEAKAHDVTRLSLEVTRNELVQALKESEGLDQAAQTASEQAVLGDVRIRVAEFQLRQLSAALVAADRERRRLDIAMTGLARSRAWRWGRRLTLGGRLRRAEG
jgi:hypothetical protein